MSTLHAFDIPEDDTALPAWLESQLASPRLAELAAELTVLQEAGSSAHGGGSGERTLDGLLENRVPQVCERGLAVVPPHVLWRLFRYPNLLIELQTRVLTDGGAYWDKKLKDSPELSEMVDTGWSRLQASLLSGQSAGDSSQATSLTAVRPYEVASPAQVAGNRKQTRPARLRWFVAGLATAAAVAVGAVLIRDRPGGSPQVAKTEWGWNRPDAFTKDVTREQYLNGLADAAEEWRRKRPDTPQALAQRINEFREGCSRLILAEHKPLPPKDQEWLRDRCRAWAKKFDEELAEVEAGKGPLAVRGEVDETVNKLVAALRNRAQQAAPT
jgi:hypothetical protein